MSRDLKFLQERIGYHFKNKDLLINAMMHSSYVNEKHLPKYECNERIEFLGDAVLEIVSSEFLYFEDTTMPEGKLTKLRASIVCEPTLALCAKEIGLGDYLLLGRGEDASGGRRRDSITSDALEALIGAIYLDGGFASAKEFIMSFVLNDLEHKKLFFDSKTILQEMVQRNGHSSIHYKLVEESGPDHNKSFKTQVVIDDETYGMGFGRTKKLSEQQAAYQTILMLRNEEGVSCI